LKKSDRDFLHVVKILSENNIPYWICHGTLLGVIRDNKILEWDKDLDFAVWKNEVPKAQILDLMKNSYFKVIDDGKMFDAESDYLIFEGEGDKTIDFNFYDSVDGIIAKSTWISVPASRKNSIVLFILGILKYNKSIQCIYNNKFLKIFFERSEMALSAFLHLGKTGYSTPHFMLKNFYNVKFLGESVRIPVRSEEVLEYLYGKDWKIPKPEYNWIVDSDAAFQN
jgi:hypothetical protein